MNDVQRWLNEDGLKYLRELGISKGQIIVDFGCNTGHYTIPAAKVVGPGGSVYAIEKEKTAIDQVMDMARQEGLDNIIPVNSDNAAIALPADSVDCVFTYDVLHYLDLDERNCLYQSVYAVLKENGILTVFPKHNQTDQPRWHLERLSTKDITTEIENNNFMIIQKKKRRIIHDDIIESGMIINFKKSKTVLHHEKEN